MFCAFAIPLADLRLLMPHQGGQRAKPPFPPQPGTHFLRNFGGFVGRDFHRSQPVENLSGEDVFCDVSRGVRFLPDFANRVIGSGTVLLKPHCVFRRLYGDGGVTARLEIALRPNGRSPQTKSATGKDAIVFAKRLAEMEIVVGTVRVPVRSAGKAVALHYQASTTIGPAAPHCVIAGEPIVFLEFGPGELEDLPRDARLVETVVDAQTGLETKLLFVWVCWPDRTRVGLWMVVHSSLTGVGSFLPLWSAKRLHRRARPTPHDKRLGRELSFDSQELPRYARRLRMHLVRMHAEREVLKVIFQQIGIHVHPQSGTELHNWETLLLRAEALCRPTRFGLNQRDILTAVADWYDFAIPGSRANLERQLDGAGNRSVRTRALNALSRLLPARGGALVYVQGDIVGTKQTISTGDITGSTVIVGVRQKIVNSTISNTNECLAKLPEDDKAARLKEEIDKLSAAVAALVTRMNSDEAATDAGESFNQLVTQATKESPSRKWYELSAKGLLEAANSVAELATPIGAAVKAISLILGFV